MPLLRTLGQPALLTDEGEQLLPKGKPLALLAYCAADRRRTISRDECASLLWSDMPTERARHSVRQAIWRLRKLLGDDFATRDDLITGVAAGLRTDREQFLEAAHADNASEALRLYGGPYLEGLILPGGDEYDDWLQFERHRLEDTLVQVVERAVERALETERRGEARELADALLHRAPAHLTGRRLAIECALAAGDLAAARQDADALEAHARAQAIELPARLIQAIARTRKSESQQVGDATPAVTLDFVGRDGPFSDILEAWQGVQQGGTRMFFVTGAAGIGKSRLLQVVHRRCATRPARAVLVRANAGEQSVAYGFASLLIRALAALPGAMGVAEASARELVALDPTLATSLKVNPAPWDAVEGPRRRALALLDLLQAVAEQQPVALLIDDWHWMDASSRELVTVALGRCDGMPLLVLLASRQTQELPAIGTLQRMALAPLTLEDSLEALRSTGGWPPSPEVSQFLMMLATASRGVPLDLYERLTMAVETRQLQWRAGEWQADDWERLANDLAAASPLARRLAACDDVERQLLLMLTVAGTPVRWEVLAEALELSPVSASDINRVAVPLPVLESKGLVRIDAHRITLAHDTIADAMLELTTRDARRAAHAALASTLAAALEASMRAPRDASASDAADSLAAMLRKALRHALHAGDDALAGGLLARIVRANRARGDTRSARAVLTDEVGTMPSHVDALTVLRHVPLWHRTPRPSVWQIGVVSLLMVVGALAAAWRVSAAPSLRVMQAPTSVHSAPLYGPDIYRPVPAVVVATESGPDSVTVRVNSVDGRGEVVAGAEQRVARGTVSLSALRVRLRDSSAVLRVSADGHRAVEIVVHRNFGGTDPSKGMVLTARFVEGNFGRRRVTPRQYQLRVRAGERVTGVVQMRYTSALSAASVWVSYTPSWGDPATQGRELFPVTTPTLSDILDLPVSFVAPDVPGSYWLIFILAAEPSGGFALSSTNWTMEHPIWTDGNDVARLPDSLLIRGNRDGQIERYLAYPSTWNASACDLSLTAVPGTKQCRQKSGLFAIPVVVDAPPAPATTAALPP